VLAMLGFMLGGISGLINGSYNVNQVVHNTAFIPGHFHLTIGTAVALSYMGIAYWLIPFLTNRSLRSPKLARLQGWIYFVGVMIFSNGLMAGGLLGMPRRTMMTRASYVKFEPSWWLPGLMTGIGGSLMFAAAVLFFFVLVMTALFGKPPAEQDLPLTETVLPAAASGWQLTLDRFGYWIALTLILIVIAYGPFVAMYLPPKLTSPGFQAF
jgi:cytochrome c oxidase subunit 1